MNHSIALFGEAEKGRHRFLHFFSSLPEMAFTLGNPPQNSQGLYLAVQILLFKHHLIFFKVEEEGFSKEEYLHGIKLIKASKAVKGLSAICLPGVGDKDIIEPAIELCQLHNSIIITSEKDFYDYFTSGN